MTDYYYIQNNDIYSNSIYSNGKNGIYFTGWLTISYITIQNNNIYLNLIHSNAYSGVHINATAESASVIQNNNLYSNIIYQHNSSYWSSGILVYAEMPISIYPGSNFYNNTIVFNTNGIVLVHTISHIIFANNISRNNNGMWLEQSSSNTVRYNSISYNNQSGITLISSSNDNIIENNNINSNNKTGILITDNSNNNLITRNNITFNAEVGLNTSDSSGNEIHHNNFINNAQNAYDSTIALNDWDDGAEGNYWSDYLGTDDDSDGFGEDPYVIPGGGSRDWHPIMIPLNITAPYIIFTSPANGDINVPVDTMISVTFSKEMNTTTVENAISISGGLSPIDFVWDPSNEIVTFTPSSNLTSKTTYTVTITTDARDILGNRMEDTYIFSFTSEDIEPPEISITSPYNGETNVEINADIVVTFNEPMQYSTVTYSCAPDPGGWVISWSPDNMIATYSHNDFGSEITYTFQITAGKDIAGNELVAGPVPNPWSFISADVVGPEIISTIPVDGSQNISTTANIEVNFNEQMDISSVTYTCAPNPMGWSVTWAIGDTSAIFSHNEFAQKTMYTFHIVSAKDVSGNDLNPSVVANPWSFTTTGDYIAPQISLTSPANNAENVDPDANIVVTFSEAMNASLLNYVCIPDPGGWSESWSAGNTVVTFTHNPFNSSELYVFQITGAKDLADNNLVAGSVPNPWLFQIADIIAPTIVLTSPQNGTTNVVQTANVVVTFSEAMNTASITYICSPNPTGWSVSGSGGDTVATFMHNPFDNNTIYTFHITSGKDFAGNDLTAGIVPNPWSFTTIDNMAPTIISTLPSDSAINIGLDQVVTVTFTEAMNTSSLTFSCFPDPGGWSSSWGSGDTVVIFSHNAFMDSTTYTFHIANVKDIAGNNLVPGAVPNPWSFTTEDITAPTITATTPPNGAKNILLNQDVIITFSESMDNTTVTCTCLPDPGGWSVVWNGGNTVATFSHNPFIEATTYTFHVTGGNDLAGDSLVAGSIPNPWSFTTQDITEPQIIATLPINGSIDISLNANIVVTFSKAMDTSSVDYICIPDPGGWSESWSAGNIVVTFSHNPLANGTTYGFQITSGKDIMGNDLIPHTVPNPWSFTTIGKLVAPQITWTSPANNAVNLDPNTNIIVTFSQEIDPSSLNYICTPDPGGWSESWNSDNTVVSLSHNPLEFGTTYTFHITEGKDTAGNNLTSGVVPHSWNFTTISVDSIIVTPSEVTIPLNGTFVLIAQAYDEHNNPITGISYIWGINSNLGTISPQGSQIVSFKALSNVGTCYVNVTAGGKSASAQVIIKSDELSKEETEDSPSEDMIWISFLWLVIIIACIVIVVVVIWKKGVKNREDSGSVESAVPEETVDEKPEIIQESISEPTPSQPPPKDD
ncbi:MAG: Ig-like domain-containing protein [Thermoplasmata archaeon]|nr:MAG: Ig-like domain-containing protein [Thermoplasmata archaeon]